MEPDRQMEIQLGHMCNNRCVFCVSGQRTEMREAFPLEGDPIIAKIREGYDQGIRKLTLLGGEPTLQPEFMSIVRAAVAMGFGEIVIFTNGAKTARAAFVDEVLATGGNFTWRFSLQGGTGAAHDRTTKKLGSFQRIMESMKHLRDRAQRTTVNMCVVQSNFASVGEFPRTLAPYPVQEIHLDMVRPMDAGVRTEDEMRAMLPRYSDMVPHFEKMVAGFPDGFDVNIGNLPYCIAPQLAPWIHHDGQHTLTVAIDDDDALSEAWDKYAVKRRDKIKREECTTCVFDAQCSGVFDTYRRFYGMDEFVPVTHASLAVLDPARRMFTLHVKPAVERLEGWSPTGWDGGVVRTDARNGEIGLAFRRAGGDRVEVALRRPGGGVAGTDRFGLHVTDATVDGAAVGALVRELFARLCDGSGMVVLHPPGPDVELAPGVDRRITSCLGRLRARVPFGTLRWRDVELGHDGRSAAVSFDDAGGTRVTIGFEVRGNAIAPRYALTPSPTGAPPTGLVEGVRAALEALRAPL